MAAIASLALAATMAAATAGPNDERPRTSDPSAALAQATPSAAFTARGAEDDLKATVTRLIAEPLSVDNAVRLALIYRTRTRSLEPPYFNYGLFEGEINSAITATERPEAQASSPTKLIPDIEHRFIRALIGERRVTSSYEIDRRKGDLMRLEIASDLLRFALETRKAYVAAVAAGESLEYVEAAAATVNSSAELMARVVRVGNLPKTDQLRLQVLRGEMTTQVARARQAALSTREQLTRRMGLWGDNLSFRLPARLPNLPKAAVEISDPEAVALARRLDLEALRLELTTEARDLERDGYDGGRLRSARNRYIPVAEPDRFLEEAFGADGARKVIDVPVFDRREARLSPDMRSFMQMVDRFADLGGKVRSEAREAYHAYRTAYDAARHYRDIIVPLRKQISEENQLRYNGMLISVFDLLDDGRDQIATVIASIDAQKEFWRSDADFRMALVSGGYAAETDAAVGLPSAAAPQH